MSMERILSAAIVTGADAIHPGFGFLSENSKFAQLCKTCGLTFIGPSPEVIERLGNKSIAKKTMEEAGVPVIPGNSASVYKMCIRDRSRTALKRIGNHHTKRNPIKQQTS